MMASEYAETCCFINSQLINQSCLTYITHYPIKVFYIQPTMPQEIRDLVYMLTLILLTWRIWWVPNNASRWQMGFNSADTLKIVSQITVYKQSRTANFRHPGWKAATDCEHAELPDKIWLQYGPFSTAATAWYCVKLVGCCDRSQSRAQRCMKCLFAMSDCVYTQHYFVWPSLPDE